MISPHRHLVSLFQCFFWLFVSIMLATRQVGAFLVVDLGRPSKVHSITTIPSPSPLLLQPRAGVLGALRSSSTDRETAPTLPTTDDNEVSTIAQGEMLMSDVAFCVVDFGNIYEPFVTSLESESTFVDFTDDGLIVPAGPMGQLKEQLANMLAEPFVEVIIASSVLLNSLLVALSTVASLSPYKDTLRVGELFVSVLFCLDFLGRWFSSSKEPGRHVLDPQFALDVVVVILPLVVGLTPSDFWDDSPIPSGLTSPSGLFNLELLRVLRLRRVLRDLSTFERFAERALLGVAERRTVKKLVQEWQLQLARVLLSLFTLVSVATGLIYTAENGVNPSINNYFDALYFGLTTLTTVGFGDISPQTWQGKLIICGSILVGVAVVPAQAAALVEALLEREDEKKRSRNRPGSAKALNGSGTPSSTESVIALDTSKTCPKCGATFHWTNAQFCYSCGGDLDS